MRCLIIICFLFLQFTLFSQNKRIDSLYIQLDKASEKNKILVLNELAIEFWGINPSKSEEIAKDALKLENQYKFYNSKARTYNIIGVANFYSKNFEKADALSIIH